MNLDAAICRRFVQGIYSSYASGTNTSPIGTGVALSTTSAEINIPLSDSMDGVPYFTKFTATDLYIKCRGTTKQVTSASILYSSNNSISLTANFAAITSATYYPVMLYLAGGAYIVISSET